MSQQRSAPPVPVAALAKQLTTLTSALLNSLSAVVVSLKDFGREMDRLFPPEQPSPLARFTTPSPATAATATQPFLLGAPLSAPPPSGLTFVQPAASASVKTSAAAAAQSAPPPARQPQQQQQQQQLQQQQQHIDRGRAVVKGKLINGAPSGQPMQLDYAVMFMKLSGMSNEEIRSVTGFTGTRDINRKCRSRQDEVSRERRGERERERKNLLC
jgi:hypothetical protein